MTGCSVLLHRPEEGEETLIVYVSDMGKTATTYTDAGTYLDTRYGYHVKAKDTHGLSDVSNFARNDTWLLSGNTANATIRRVHGPHRSAQQQPEKHCASPRRVHDVPALLTLYGAPDCRRRYAEGPGAAPLATISMTAASCSSDNRRGAPSFLPSALAFSKPALVRRRMDTSS